MFSWHSLQRSFATLSSKTTTTTLCEAPSSPAAVSHHHSHTPTHAKTMTGAPPMPAYTTPPPRLIRVESAQEKFWRKFTSQPLVPIGCVATAYFLASGIKSFRDRDPVKSQRMMKARVMAQFATLLCFIGYLGLEKLDFRVAPMYQEKKKAAAAAQQPPQQPPAAGASASAPASDQA